MAFVTVPAIGSHGPSIFQKLSTVVVRYFAEASEGNMRLRAVRQLQAKSDRELADIGIPRHAIVHRVFRDRIGA